MARETAFRIDWEVDLMLSDWAALLPGEQTLAVSVARREGVEDARRTFRRSGGRSPLLQPVGLADYRHRFVLPGDGGLPSRWEAQEEIEQRRDPRVYHYCDAMERERRRLSGDSALSDAPELLQRSAHISRNLATTISAQAVAEAELAEMVAWAAGDKPGDPPGSWANEPSPPWRRSWPSGEGSGGGAEGAGEGER